MTEATAPSPNGDNGREKATGRFAVGNRAGKGNPHARRIARLRAEVLRAVGPREIRAVVHALGQLALAGDVTAAREILNRAIGTPCAGSNGAPQIVLPELRTAADVAQAQAVVVDHLARGAIDATQADVLGNALERTRRAIDLSDIDERLRALERDRNPNG